LLSNQKKNIFRFILVKIIRQLSFAWPSAAEMLKRKVIGILYIAKTILKFSD